MKRLVCFAVAAAILGGAPVGAAANDIEFKPIDTKKLVVAPSKVAANLAAGTINLAGQAAANHIENNGWVKTVNNVFSIKRLDPRYQAGPSALPTPNMFKSTHYQSYNTPTMPSSHPLKR
jgi:hypothetical protein